MPTCEKYGFTLNKPCSCTQCSHHITEEDTFNCMYEHLRVKGTQITINDATEILEITKKDFNEAVQKAIDESRVNKLDSVIGAGNEFEYVPNSNICIVCGSHCKKKSLSFNGLSYCSSKCLNHLPVKIASLMNRLGVDEHTLLYALVNLFSGEKICEFLGISDKFFKQWVLRLTGIKIKEVRDIAPQNKEPVILEGKPIKITNKYRSKAMIFNDDPMFKNIEDFCAI